MLRWKGLLGLSFLGLGATSYYQYHHNNSFRSLAHLAYAGTRMALVYKLGNDPIQVKNEQASVFLRDALKDNGGIYLKLGQLIATLDVIVPDEYRQTMNTLTRDCEVTPFEDIQKTIQQDLGYPMDVVFRGFQKTPISSASIAQVHRAQLLNGEIVAVKVQHRDLAEHVENDLAMMRGFVEAAKWLFKDFKYDWLVDGFEKNIRIQLDFRTEASNMKRTQHFLKENNFKNIYVPQLLLKPTSRVLVMEFINGTHLDEVQKLKMQGINTRRLGRLFANMIIKMIHKEGFVHADTHSGNLMARKYKGKDQLVVIDHGLYQELDPMLLRSYNEFWLGLILNDAELYEPAGRQLGTTNPKLLRAMLTSRTDEELNDQKRNIFDLNPSTDRARIMKEAAKNHQKIISTLQEMKRQILLLMKVNEFARSIENMLSGRQMGVYQDIATECVQNMGFPFWRRWLYYFQMWWTNR